MKNLSKLCLACLLSVIVLSPSYAVTMLDEEGSSAEQNVAGNSFLNAELIGRYNDGRLDTSLGEYKITAGVKVDDRRPMDQWLVIPAKAQIQLEFVEKQLIQVIIY